MRTGGNGRMLLPRMFPERHADRTHPLPLGKKCACDGVLNKAGGVSIAGDATSQSAASNRNQDRRSTE